MNTQSQKIMVKKRFSINMTSKRDKFLNTQLRKLPRLKELRGDKNCFLNVNLSQKNLSLLLRMMT